MTVIKDGGQFGAPPDANPVEVAKRPDGSAVITGQAAPHETSQPLSAELIHQQLALAAQNEQVLPPFNPPGVRMAPTPTPTQPAGGTPIAPNRSRLRMPNAAKPPVATTAVETVTAEADLAGGQLGTVAPAAILTPPTSTSLGAQASVVMPAEQPPLSPVLPHMRAASNTDSPSRGIPTPSADPGKRITGGFGDPAEGQYFPLDGLELRAVVERLLSELHTRIQDDLRFSIAITYPRVRVRVDVIVEAYASEGGFTVTKVAAPHERTPLAVAEQFAEDVVFIVRAERREFDEQNQPQDAPNAMRREAGLTVPMKQRMETSAGIIYADK